MKTFKFLFLCTCFINVRNFLKLENAFQALNTSFCFFLKLIFAELISSLFFRALDIRKKKRIAIRVRNNFKIFFRGNDIRESDNEASFFIVFSKI